MGGTVTKSTRPDGSENLHRRRDHSRGRLDSHGQRSEDIAPLNKYCQSHDVKNLFVADAAPFVSNPDKNPTLTICRAGMADVGISGGRNEERQCLEQSQRSGVRGQCRTADRSRSDCFCGACRTIGIAEAQHVHNAAAADTKVAGGVYKPKALTQHEFDTLRKLSEIIVPGATKGGAAEFIDLLSSQNPEMAAIYTGGLAWLDDAMKRTYHADVSCREIRRSKPRCST